MDNKKNITLTRGTKKIIAKAIEGTNSLNSSELCDFICNDLCEKFSGDSLDYQLERMNIATTKSIMDAIDVYIYRHSKKNELVISKKDKKEEK